MIMKLTGLFSMMLTHAYPLDKLDIMYKEDFIP